MDDRWRRLTAGELSAEEQEALRLEAEQTEQGRRDWEAFRPLGDGVRNRILAQIQAQSRRDPSGGEGSAEAADEATAESVADEDPGREPIPFSAGPKTSSPARAPMALAAALLLTLVGGWWLTRQQEPSWPAFEAELLGARQELRSDENDTRPVFAVGDTLRVRFRPPAAMQEELQSAFYLQGPLDQGPFDAQNGAFGDPATDAETVRLKGRKTVRLKGRKTEHAEGVVELEARLAPSLGLAPGAYDLIFVYGRPGSLPEPPFTDPSGATWRLERVPFELVEDPSRSEDDALPLEVSFAGCYEVLPGPICAPYPSLRLWIRSHPEAELDLRVAGRTVDAERVAVDQGFRVVLPVTPDDGSVEVEARYAGLVRSFRLDLKRQEQPAWLKGAHRQAYDGDDGAARRALEAALEQGLADGDPASRAVAQGLLARLIDAPERQMELLRAALVDHCVAGHLLVPARDLSHLIYLHGRQRDLGAVEALLDDPCRSADSDDILAADGSAADGTTTDETTVLPAEARVIFATHRGELQADRGDFRSALDQFQAAATEARRLGLDRKWTINAGRRARLLQRMGRGAEAAAAFDELLRAEHQGLFAPCDRVRLLSSAAWNLILAGGAHGDPLPLARQAVDGAARAGCDDVDLRIHLGLNLSLAHAAAGQSYEALRSLAEIETLKPDANRLQRLWWLDLEGRIAAADGRHLDALDHYRAMEAAAASAAEPGAGRQAKVRQAAALEALGELEPAVRAFAAAEALLDEQSLRIPLDEGREAFLADREQAVQRQIRLLLRLGRAEQALDVARRSHARVLRALRQGHRLSRLTPSEQLRWDSAVAEYRRLRSQIDERARLAASRPADVRGEIANELAALGEQARRVLDQAFATDEPVGAPELPPLRADELLLVYHPLPEGWVAFAAGGAFADDAAVTSRRFQLPEGVSRDGTLGVDPQDLTERLLAPFAAELDAASKIRVLALDELRRVDFHALPWRGSVLQAWRPVVYGLDLERPAAPRAALRTALIIEDPTFTLPGAAREAELVQQVLERDENALDVLRLGGGAATPSSVARRLEQLDLLHFAGHSRGAGPYGWDGAMVLADRRPLLLGDLLSLKRAPRQVVLSSCEGIRAGDGFEAQIGLAQAFLVAGAERVVAATRRVNDRDTRRLVQALYADAGASMDLGERLRQAQLTLRQTDPEADWAAFRVLEL